MSLFIASLNSGSNGNCYYVGSDNDAVLIDAGISSRETEKRMDKLGLSMQLVRAIFISHEHIDHIRGMEVLAKKYRLPIYITPATLKQCPLLLSRDLVLSFTANQPVAMGELTVTPFTKLHDAIDPHSFIVEGRGVTIGVLTDIGKPCKEVVRYFGQCDAAFLETNYDEQLLEKGSYPHHLKKRIRGGKGHLSNMEALQLFTEHKPAFMSHLILSHLSKDNNRPELVHDLFLKHAGETYIVVASRYKETAVYQIKPKGDKVFTVRKTTPVLQPMQMSLFD